MYAVVATGGKQLKVSAGDEVVVEKLDAPVGETVNFNVIFLADEGEITVDPDALSSAAVTAEVLEHFKGEKAIIFKFKKRKGYKRLKGHRQELTKVRITDIVAEAAPVKKKAAPRKKKTEEPVEPVAETVESAQND
jgi:large subunit ribosomal protein L21